MTEQMLSRFYAARKKYIASQFASLNREQMKAVMATEGPLLMLAGAGSGKTTALVNRIVNLLRFGRGSDTNEYPEYLTEDDIAFLENLSDPLSDHDTRRADMLCAVEPAAPWSIIAITFTNKAAREMKERLSALGQPADDVWASTFHAACCRILRKDIDRLGYSKHFTIYDTADSERMMKDIIKDMGLDDKTFPAKYVLSIISREKDKMIGPEQMRQNIDASGDYRLRHVAEAYARYQNKLKENDALDFDDIIYRTVQLLQQNEDIRTYYQRKFRYVLVDEYQDTNHLQYLLTSLLAGGYENICVVGDDDQSIYRFRGATIENILEFESQYTGSRIIRLEQNYRSTQSILNAANAVIAHNLGRKGKRLWTDNDAGDKITVYQANDEGDEARYVADQIIWLKSKGVSFKENAILYRTNAQSNAIEYALKRNGIHYHVFGGMRFFDRAEIKDMLSYLCVINNRTDDLRLRRIINNPPRGIGAKTIEIAERLAAAEGKGLYHVISHPEDYAPLEKSAGKLRQFCQIVEDLDQYLADNGSLSAFYDEVLARTGYVAMLEGKPTEENKTRLENVRELKSSILSFEQNSEFPMLAGFLEEIALYTDLEAYNDDDDAVVMMTMHSAKGLEFPNVYLVGFEDGLFPGMRAIGDYEEMEEERRLCYVAITRAMQRLTISHARQRMLYGRTNASLPSRFLKEIPGDLTSVKSAYVQPTPQRYGYVRPQTANNTTPTRSYLQQSVSQPKTPKLELNKGDMVQHSAFGRGLVISVIKMGSDALLEIAFDEIGTKKLMANSASAYMKRL